MNVSRLLASASFAGAFSVSAACADNAVLFWNQQALDATRLARQPPPVIALHLGTFHAVIADTVDGIDTARPETVIRETDKSVNPYIKQRADWIPNMASLPFPSYPSAHMTFTAAAAKVLALYFGRDDITFSTTSDGLPGAVRTFHKLSDAAEEVGMSRIFGGIHTTFDVTAGKDAGAMIGDWVFTHALQPLD